MKDVTAFDGLWLERFKFQAHEGVLYRELSQPSRTPILERNAALRAQGEGVIRDLSFGRLALTIPFEDHEMLKAKYPDLASKDAQIKTQAWQRFMQSDESIPYRVR